MMPLGKTNSKRVIKCLEKKEQKPIDISITSKSGSEHTFIYYIGKTV